MKREIDSIFASLDELAEDETHQGELKDTLNGLLEAFRKGSTKQVSSDITDRFRKLDAALDEACGAFIERM